MTLTTREPERTREEPAEPAGPGVTDSGLARSRRWLAHAPAERVPLPLIPAIWTAAEIMHAAGVRGFYVGVVSALATAVAGWMGERRSKNAEHKRLAGIEVAAVTAAAGTWVTAGAELGPLAGPDHLLSVLYLAASGGGYWWLRRHDAVRAARARRAEAAAWEARKTAWHRLAAALGLTGSHLLEYEETLLGETMLIDTRSTGKRASQISSRDVAERLGELEMIPIGRIDVTTDRIPGRLRISIRRKDPWATGLTHPAVDPSSPFAKYVPEPFSIRKPLVIGGDPETGDPLRLTLWDEDEGGKVVGIFAKKGSGKTVLLSCITERITACPDAQLIQVNLGKHREDRRWAPLAAVNALGRDQGGRARYALQWVVEAIEARSKGGDDARVTPAPATPLLVVKIDEIDQVAGDPVCQRLLDNIASKCRSEGVALIFAGQRATAQWMGGANLRANVDIAILGRFARSGEARKAVGEEVDLPDMGEYGEGRPGVFLITELGGGGGYERGRVFNLHKPEDIDAVVSRRAAGRRPYVPEPALGRLDELWAKVTGAGRPGAGEDLDDGDGVPQPGLARGQVIPGTGQITAKIGQARALAEEDPELAEIPPEMAAHAAEQLAERRRQFLDAYTSVELPEPDRRVLLAMLARPDGVSTRAAAAALPWSHTRVHQQLQRWQRDGIAEMRGKGSGRRWHHTGGQDGTEAPGTGYPPLRAVPDAPESNAQ